MKGQFNASFFILLLSLGLVVVNIACRDIESPPKPDPWSRKNDTGKLFVSTTHSPGVSKIEYDADGRLVKFMDDDKNTVSVTYLPDSIVYSNISDNISIREVFELDHEVVKKSKHWVSEHGGEKPELFTVFYAYKDGKLEKEVYSKDGEEYAYSVFVYDDSNKNLLKSEQYLSDGILAFKRTFEYTALPNKSGLLDDDNNNGMGASLFPKKSENLIRKVLVEDYLNNPGNILHYSQEYTYEVDSEGYVVKVTRASGGVVDSWVNVWE